MKFLKTFIILVHIFLGLIIIFLNVNYQILTYGRIHNTSKYYSSEDLKNSGIADFIENLKQSEPRIIAEGIFGIILGLFSIIGAVAFIKDKRWAAPALPIVTLIILMIVVLDAFRSATGFLVGPYLLAIFLLLIILVSEILHITLRKQASPN
ncbi:MAG TPA: hypothetical protein VJJ52_03205 [Candidatus Nanoarchaeia archaeon]|nr:hypothetical protein [Candidatus Nanoarchaeia archaeon]